MKLSKNAIVVLKKKYLKKNEPPEAMFRRVAKNISKGNKKLEKEFYNSMINLEFLPNTPALRNAGRVLQQLSACFVLPIYDSMEDIFQSVKDMALIQKTGGGVGFSFSRLRPEGSKVGETGGIASGPVSFMKVFDSTTAAIKEGGIRRGANMGILRVDHPDIIKFITAKKNPDELNNFNISVALTDKFMQAVIKNKKYSLYDPHLKKQTHKLSAKKVFNLLCYMSWLNGEPGVIFIDRINKFNPIKNTRIEAVNPCLDKTTWILTKKGPFQIKDLIKKDLKLIINGNFYNTKGFFSTGKRQRYTIITKEGYEIIATEDHFFLVADKITRSKIYKKWKPLRELSQKDYLILNDNRYINWKGKGTFEEGYLLGSLIGDGYLTQNAGVISVWRRDNGAYSMISEIERITKSIFQYRKDFLGFQKETKVGYRRMRLKALKDLALNYRLNQNNKIITPEIEKTSFRFHCGFLKGMFDTDGSVQGNLKKGVSIRIWQSNLNNIKALQRMLQRVGIISKIYKRKGKENHLMPDGKGGKKLYSSKEGYELVISKDNILIYAEKVNFLNESKGEKLSKLISSYKRKNNKERFICRIKKILKIGKEEVFDIQVPNINMFDANGVIVHNCAEQPLLPYESCVLGSINLNKFIENKKINYDKLKKVIKIAVNFLDNVIDVTKYPIPEIEKATKSNRKIGLGIMGWADLLIKLEIPYDSNKAIQLAEKLMKFITNEARRASIELGKQKGSFPNFKKSIYYKQYKHLRNATVTTIAPTGTLNLIADCSSGIEPIFSKIFYHDVMEHTKLYETHKGKFKTAHEIKPEWHVKMQAAFQKYTDNAISKTVNLKKSASVSDVKKIYLLAYKLGSKGIAVYREKSRPAQVLNVCKSCK